MRQQFSNTLQFDNEQQCTADKTVESIDRQCVAPPLTTMFLPYVDPVVAVPQFAIFVDPSTQPPPPPNSSIVAHIDKENMSE
jgi:hypothetical protein